MEDISYKTEIWPQLARFMCINIFTLSCVIQTWHEPKYRWKQMKEAIIYTCSINIQQYLTCLKNISGECVRQMTETGKRRRTVNVLSKKNFFLFSLSETAVFLSLRWWSLLSFWSRSTWILCYVWLNIIFHLHKIIIV